MDIHHNNITDSKIIFENNMYLISLSESLNEQKCKQHIQQPSVEQMKSEFENINNLRLDWGG